jgi:hypothetical protein
MLAAAVPHKTVMQADADHSAIIILHAVCKKLTAHNKLTQTATNL